MNYGTCELHIVLETSCTKRCTYYRAMLVVLILSQQQSECALNVCKHSQKCISSCLHAAAWCMLICMYMHSYPTTCNCCLMLSVKNCCEIFYTQAWVCVWVWVCGCVVDHFTCFQQFYRFILENANTPTPVGMAISGYINDFYVDPLHGYVGWMYMQCISKSHPHLHLSGSFIG